MLAHYEIKVTRTDKIKDPIKTSNEQHQEGGFFEKLEKEISDELNDEPEKK